MRVLILYNPISGSGDSEARAAELARTLNASDSSLSGAHRAEIQPTSLDPTESWLDPLLSEGVELLVVVGGDGAMRMAAPAAMRCGTTIYHYPGGTENLFAREYGMRADPTVLIDAIEHGEPVSVDAFEFDGAFGLICASVGLDAGIIHDLDAHRSGAITHLSYLGPLLRQSLAWRRNPPRWRITVDGRTLTEWSSGLMLLANSPQYALRLDPVFHANPSDGRLDAAHFPTRGLLGLLGWAIRFRRRSQFRRGSARIDCGAEIRIEVDRPVHAQLDGDLLPGPPRSTYHCRVVRSAFSVLPPAVRE